MHSIVEKGGEGGKRFFFTSLLKSSIKLFMGEGKSIFLSSLLDALPAHSKTETFSFLPPENPPRANISQSPSETGTSWVQPGQGGAFLCWLFLSVHHPVSMAMAQGGRWVLLPGGSGCVVEAVRVPREFPLQFIHVLLSHVCLSSYPEALEKVCVNELT